MRKFTLIILSSLIAFCAYSQKVVITEPASIAGAYTFGTGFGAVLTDSIWCGEIVLMDDGADPNTDGCEQTTNDYTGKVVMIDRGACQFGTKALQAQNVGAIAVIIVNNQTTGAIGMAGGNDGGMVTIPVVSLSLADGDIIKPVLAGEPVSICIGFKIYDHDLTMNTSNSANILFPSRATLTTDQMGLDSSFVYTPVVRIVNSGQADQTNVVATVRVSFGGNDLYNESLTLPEIREDSTGFLVFPDYLFTDATIGDYDVEVTAVADSTDQDPSDNGETRAIKVLESYAAKCSWDETNNLPNQTLLTTIGADPGTDHSIEFYQGISFPLGGVTIDSFTTSIGNSTAGATSLEGNSVLFTLNEWNDADGNFGYDDGEFFSVGVANVDFDATSGVEERVTVPFFNTDANPEPGLEQKILVESDKAYVIGEKYLGVNTITFAFDGTYPNFFSFGLTGISDFDLPYAFTRSFTDGSTGDLGTANLSFFTDFGNTLSVGYYTSPYEPSAVEDIELKGSVNVYPNPASDELWAEINLEDVSSELILTVYSNTGQLLSSRMVQHAKEEKLRYDTTRLTAGSYYIKVRSENQVKVIPFVIVK